MNVMIIPEDFRKDQYILQPIITAMLAAVGKPRAKVEVCRDPLLGGISHALDLKELDAIVRSRPTVDLFLLCVDRDAEAGRRERLNQLEAALQPHVQKPGAAFFGENAWQEIEVWALVGHDLPREWNWQDIRAERDSKERFFARFARTMGVDANDDGGRQALGRAAASRYRRIVKLCREDVLVLHTRVEAWLAGKGFTEWSTANAMLT